MMERFAKGCVKLGASEKSRALYLGDSYVMPVGDKPWYQEGHPELSPPLLTQIPHGVSEGTAPGLGIKTGSLVAAALSLEPTMLWLKTRK